MSIGDLIRAARKKMGVTQVELARRLGTSYVTVSQWETGQRNPKFSTLQKIAAALEINVLELIPEATEHVIIPGRLSIVQKNDPESPYYQYDIKAADAEALAFGQSIFENTGLIMPPIGVLAKLSEMLPLLNETGQTVALERVAELTKIPEYRNANVPFGVDGDGEDEEDRLGEDRVGERVDRRDT